MLLNFGQQVFSFTFDFYMVPFAHATTWVWPEPRWHHQCFAIQQHWDC